MNFDAKAKQKSKKAKTGRQKLHVQQARTMMIMNNLILVLSISLLVVPPELIDGAADSCTLTCLHGECELGDANWDDHPRDANGNAFDFLRETNRDGWKCNCPDNWSGIRCGREFEVCGDTGHYCYHGGKCIDDLETTVEADKLFCDCNDAVHNGFHYVGKFCEHRGAEQCGNTEKFCSNGGTCKDGFENLAHPCDCPNGHRGDHCEFLLGEVPECVLACANGGTCQLGIKDYDTAWYDEFWARHDGNFMYCNCPDGFFGPLCDVEGEQCGDNHCFNGASCVQTYDRNNDVTYRCDCQTAATNEKSFAGQFCQSESTTFCNKEADHNGHLFCTNGGTCLEESHEGCSCPEGFHGPICEFQDVIEDQVCDLKCENGGHCRKGTKDNQLFQQYGAELNRFNMTHTEMWEHCVCPQGYFGIQCEHKLEICPGGDHVCLHGAKCVATEEASGGTGHTCDCDHGFDAFKRYAGKFCQYSSTDICTDNGQPGVGKANFAFCVNNGTCKKKVGQNEAHPGCDCPEGFEGQHCEFLEQVETEAPVVDTKELNDGLQTNGGLVVALAIALLIFAGLLLFAIFKRFIINRDAISEAAKDVTKADAPGEGGDAVIGANSADVSAITDACSEPSGPTPFDVEGDGLPGNGELTTVEII